MSESQPETFEIVTLEAEKIRFGRDDENLTYTAADGTFFPIVTLRRCFPLSATDSHILVRIPDTEDERGRELGMITTLDGLDSASREAVMRELRLHYFVPGITRIHNIREEFGFLYWTVDTDRGPKEFVMRDSVISAVRKVSEGRWLIIDINQTRYEIYNFEALDTHGQSLLRRYLLL
jgi:hypothetical protein